MVQYLWQRIRIKAKMQKQVLVLVFLDEQTCIVLLKTALLCPHCCLKAWFICSLHFKPSKDSLAL